MIHMVREPVCLSLAHRKFMVQTPLKRYTQKEAKWQIILGHFSVTEKTNACFYPRWQLNTRNLPISALGPRDNNVFWMLTRREVRQVRPLALKPPLELVSYDLILGDFCRGCCFVPRGS